MSPSNIRKTWIEDLENPGKPKRLSGFPEALDGGGFSPDARWVACATRERGRGEVDVDDLQSGKRIRVSPDDELVVGEPQVLFKAPIPGFNRLYDVTRDGQRFLVPTGERYRPTSATILVNSFQKPVREQAGPSKWRGG